MRPDTRVFRRSLALVLAAALTAALPALAAAPIGDGVAPVCDEAYYATLDYYGNLTEGSVVKSYALNGARSLTDYGDYDEVVNLTDGTLPTVKDGSAAFRFDGTDVPAHFYFEGKTTRPFEALPWTLSLHYTLNGVPARAEDLAGKTGVVEIAVDAVPNESASQYARYNYTLEAMTLFNQDDILSLEAPGAQVQLIGNLRAVLFLALPGEEQHFVIRVGAEDFSFGGMTFLMVPATLSQLEEISKLSQRKDDLEEDYDKLSDSLDTLLDAFGNVSGSLYATANGLDELNRARGTISAGKGRVYADADALRADLDTIADVLEPVSGQMDTASRALTDTKEVLKALTEQVTSLRGQLKDLEDVLEDLQDDGRSAQTLVDDLARMKSDLKDLQSALKYLSSDVIPTVDSPFGDLSQAELSAGLKTVKGLYSGYTGDDFPDYVANAVIQKAYQAYLAALGFSQGGGTESPPAGSGTEAPPAGSGTEAPPAGSGTETPPAGDDTEETSPSAPPPEEPENPLPGGEEPSQTEPPASGNDEPAPEIQPSGGEENAAPGENASAETISERAVVMQARRVLWDAADGGEESQPPTVEEFLSTPQGKAARAQAESLAKLAGAYEADPEGLEFLVSHYNTLGQLLNGFNQTAKKVNAAVKKLAAPTASLTGRLAELCGDLDDLDDLLDDLDDLGDIARSSAYKGQKILDSVEDLYGLLDEYEPEAQEALKTVKDLSVSAADTVRDTGAFFDSFESLLKTSGAQLDSGSKKTLEGLSAALRETARSLSTTQDVKDAKRSISEIIEDTWNEYTGDVNNLLNMDADASPISLTDGRNPSPQSVQVLIRTQEIKAEEPETEETGKAAADKGTFWSRVGQMFADFWHAITGIFSK